MSAGLQPVDAGSSAVQAETVALARELALATVRLKNALEEKERLSRLLDQVLETIQTGVVLHDDADRVLAANGAARRMGAVLPDGDDAYRLAPPCADPALGGERPFRPRGLAGPTWVMRRNDVTLPGGGTGRLLTVQDVTRAVRLEEQAGRRTRLEALGRMAAEIAHEVRNPLGSLELFSSLLVDELGRPEGPGPDAREMADQILLGVRHLGGTVTHLLAAVRGRPLSRRAIDAAELGREVCAALQPVAASRGVIVEAPAADAAVMAELDPEGLRQALLNLLGNALEVTPAGGRVRVGAIADGDDVRLEVEDSGPGIAPELRERIFEPFFTTRPQGTGLGLAVVERVALSHGGAIDVGDGTLGGALFRLTLPRCAQGEVTR